MFNKKCKKTVTDRKKPSVQRYCWLLANHEGDCDPNPVRTDIMLKPQRCDVLSPTNRTCGLPKGHRGAHSRADGHATAETWNS